jgi:DNA-binding ferritin-like protein
MMNKNLDTNINFFFQTQLQLKVLHWQTKGYARHKSFGKTYEDLAELTDEFVEVCMGKHGRFILEESNKTIKIENLTDLSIVEFIQNAKKTLVSMSSELSSDNDTDLLNIRDEMLAKINKLAYLLTLE